MNVRGVTNHRWCDITCRKRSDTPRCYSYYFDAGHAKMTNPWWRGGRVFVIQAEDRGFEPRLRWSEACWWYLTGLNIRVPHIMKSKYGERGIRTPWLIGWCDICWVIAVTCILVLEKYAFNAQATARNLCPVYLPRGKWPEKVTIRAARRDMYSVTPGDE